MKHEGVVRNGVVLMDSADAFADGTRVLIEPLPSSSKVSLGNKLKRFEGKIADLPEDMARNHDHYLHGTPKK
jgi:hypothetical protein